MPSVQDLEVRVKGLEEKVAFIMKTATITAAIDSGVVGADGKPIPPRVFKGSLEEVFKLSQQLPTLMEKPNYD